MKTPRYETIRIRATKEEKESFNRRNLKDFVRLLLALPYEQFIKVKDFANKLRKEG